MTLHCFSNSCDTVVAESFEDAIAVWEETTGENWYQDYAHYDEWEQEPDSNSMIIQDEDTRKALELTCREWADKNGRGFLCSTEY